MWRGSRKRCGGGVEGDGEREWKVMWNGSRM